MRFAKIVFIVAIHTSFTGFYQSAGRPLHRRVCENAGVAWTL